MRSNMDATVLKHKDLAQLSRLWRKNVALDQVEIKQLTSTFSALQCSLNERICSLEHGYRMFYPIFLM